MIKKINSFFQKNKHLIILLGIFGIGIFTFTILTVLNHRADFTDDVVFPIQILPYETVLDWITYRYHEWSGRIFSEAFVYIFAKLPFFLWQLIAVAMYAVSSVFLFMFYRLFSTTQSSTKDYVMAIAALGLPFLMHTSVFADGAVWMTGSIVYVWMTTLALVALYPIFSYVKSGKLPKLVFIIAGVIAAIIATGSQEQVGAVLLGLTLLLLGYNVFTWIHKNQVKFPWYLVIMFLIIAIAFTVSVLAPGNKIRVDQETIRWLPDFYATPLLERLHYGYRWLIEAFINHTGYLLVLVWGLMAALLIKKPSIRLFDKAVASLLVVLIIFTLSHGIEPLKVLFEFSATWKPDLSNRILAFNVIPWGLVLITTALVPLLIFPKKKLGYFLAILFFAAVAAATIITISPTLYASGWRSVFVSSVILVVIAYLLLDKAIDAYLKHSYIFAVTIIGLALLQYAYQSAHLIKTAS